MNKNLRPSFFFSLFFILLIHIIMLIVYFNRMIKTDEYEIKIGAMIISIYSGLVCILSTYGMSIANQVSETFKKKRIIIWINIILILSFLIYFVILVISSQQINKALSLGLIIILLGLVVMCIMGMYKKIICKFNK